MRFLLLLILITNISFSQGYYYKPVTCSTCDGTGTMYWKERVTEYVDLREHKKLGWNGATSYTYSTSYQRTVGHFNKCDVCNGTGTYQKKVWKSQSKPKVRYVSSKEMLQYSYNHAVNSFKTVEDLGNGYVIGYNGRTRNLVKLDNTKVGFDYVLIAIQGYKKIYYPDGSFFAHVFDVTNRKQTFMDENFNVIYNSQNFAYPTLKDNYYWVEAYMVTQNIAVGDEIKVIKKARLKDVKTGEAFSSLSYVLPDNIEAIDLELARKDLFTAYKWIKNANNKWIKLKGIINLKEEIIVPFNVKKIISFDDEKGVIEVLNEFNLIDVYDSKGKLYEEQGKEIKKCEDGSVILSSKKKYVSPQTGEQKYVNVQTIKDGITNESFPFIFDYCSCYDNDKWFKAILAGYNDTIFVGPKNEFLSKRAVPFVVNEELSVNVNFNPIDNEFKNKVLEEKITQSLSNGKVKYGLKDYNNGAPEFDDISANIFNGKYYLIKQGNKLGALVKRITDVNKFDYILLKPNYKNIDFNNSDYNLLVVLNEENKWGVIETYNGDGKFSEKQLNKLLLPCVYDSVKLFNSELYCYKGAVIEAFHHNVYSKKKNLEKIEVGKFPYTEAKEANKIKKKIPSLNNEFIYTNRKELLAFIDKHEDAKFSVKYDRDYFCLITSSDGYSLLLKIFDRQYKESMNLELNEQLQNAKILKFDNEKKNCFVAVQGVNNKWGIIKVTFEKRPAHQSGYIKNDIYSYNNGFDEFLYSNQKNINVFREEDSFYNVDLTKLNAEKELINLVK